MNWTTFRGTSEADRRKTEYSPPRETQRLPVLAELTRSETRLALEELRESGVIGKTQTVGYLAGFLLGGLQ